MKTEELKSKKRRNILLGGFLISAGALVAKFFKSAQSTTPKENYAALAGGDSNIDHRLEFIKKSRDLTNYLSQIDIQKSDYYVAMQEKFPELMPQFRSKVGDEFWAKHDTLIFNAFYADTKKTLTEEDAMQAVRFFESQAGQNYLKWKDLIQGRNSELYKAIKKMSDERGRFSKQIIDNAATKKA